MKFGQYVRKTRQEQGISLRRMAEELAISPPYMSDIEKGNRCAPQRHILDKMAEILGLTGDKYFELLDLAAETKDDIPDDIKELLLSNKSIYRELRDKLYCQPCDPTA
jgi:transcriptional regulator with XRE-family HTH domain